MSTSTRGIFHISHNEFDQKFKSFQALLKQRKLESAFSKIIYPVLHAHERNTEAMEETKKEIKTLIDDTNRIEREIFEIRKQK